MYLDLFIKILALLILISNGLYGQKNLIDTSVYYQYGVYCEGVMVCECIIPDSLFQRLNGKFPNEEKGESLKYQKYCYNLGYDNNGEFYSFKDFEIRIGALGFEYAYPQYSFSINSRSLKEHLSNIILYSYKTRKKYDVKTLYLSFESVVKKQFNLPFDDIKLNEFLEAISERKGTLKLAIDPIEYPNHTDTCGNVLTYFPEIEFNLQ